jgi:uncharacterized protein (TIGR03084 family)
MQQAIDFVSESDALAAVLVDLPDRDWMRQTLFKGWTVNDVIVHLYFWNRAADMSLVDPDEFGKLMSRVGSAVTTGLRPMENAEIPLRGQDLFYAWQNQYREMGARWSKVDPKTRVKWAGPDMSARSSITARQMEVWSHGHEVFDCLGRARDEQDHIRNIVFLGVNTFGWSHKVQGTEVPAQLPRIRLAAPSGDTWTFGDENLTETIVGSAVEFAQVVTQVRNIRDTNLQVTGPVAQQWMDTAQCFAGPPETPPAEGQRFREKPPH